MADKNTQPEKEQVEETHTENGQETSSQGVAIYPEGKHPKDRQLAAKKVADAKAEKVQTPIVASESVVDQLPRSTRVSKEEQAAAGVKIKGELEAAEDLESGKLAKDQEKAQDEAQKDHDEKVKEAEKEQKKTK